jgi:hypothetical protein
MHYITQIFKGDVEEWVHERFVRYGRGVFDGPVLSIKKTPKALKVSGSWDYATALAGFLGETHGSIQVKGSVFAKRDLPELKDFLAVSKEKKKKGLYSADVSGELVADAFVGLLAMAPDAIFLLDASSGKSKVKCKKSLPRPGSGLDEGFCSAEFEGVLLEKVRADFLFDVALDFAEVKVSHRYIIDELVAPKGVSDSARIRVEAKRKGTLERVLEVDGVKLSKTAPLLV